MSVESDAKLILKRSDQTGVVPNPSDLEFGELALNYHDGKLFYKSDDLTVKNLAALVNDTFTASGNTVGVASANIANGLYAISTTGFAQANAAYSQANSAYNQANSGYAQANASYSQANLAYTAANNSNLLLGGTISGDLVVSGNLTVSGNSTILNIETLAIEDNDITLNSNVTGSPVFNASITVNRGTSTNTFLRWNEDVDKWGWSDDGSAFYSLDTSLSAYAAANTAANTTRVSANSGSTLNAVSLNFVNTATVTVSVTSGLNNNANVSFTAASSNPGGNDTEVQYNNSGTFGGTDLLKINSAAKAVQFANTYVERYRTLSILSNVLTVDVSQGTIFKVPLNSNITTFTITGTPAISNSATAFVLILTADGTARSINWGSTKWTSGVAPTMTSTNNKEDVFVFMSVDGGVNWYAFVSGQNL